MIISWPNDHQPCNHSTPGCTFAAGELQIHAPSDISPIKPCCSHHIVLNVDLDGKSIRRPWVVKVRATTPATDLWAPDNGLAERHRYAV